MVPSTILLMNENVQSTGALRKKQSMLPEMRDKILMSFQVFELEILK